MRLATFNILHGRSPVDDRVDLNRFRAAIGRLDADVLAMQEVDRDQPRSHGADLTAVAADAMAAPEHRFVATLAGTPDLWSAATGELQPRTAGYGIALLSRLPVLSWHALALPALRGKVPVLFPGRRRPVLVHDEPRAAVAAVVDAPQGPVTVVATHLTFIPGWNAVQLRRIVRHVHDLPRPVVVMGDLNLDERTAVRLSRMRSLASAPTYPVRAPHRQIDHILADGPVTGLEADAVDLGMSDHRALVAQVRLG